MGGAGGRAGEGAGGEEGCESSLASCDLRANSAQRALLTVAMRAIAFFQGRGAVREEGDSFAQRGGGGDGLQGDGDIGKGRTAERGTGGEVREWERALPLIDPAGVGEDVGKRIETVCRQWREVDGRIRASTWHKAYLVLVRESPLSRCRGLGASAGGEGGGGDEEVGRGGGKGGGYAGGDGVEVLRLCREKSELTRELGG